MKTRMGLKYTILCEWSKVIVVKTWKCDEPITELGEKERKASNAVWRHSFTSHEMSVQCIHNAGGIINTAIVIATGLKFVKTWF